MAMDWLVAFMTGERPNIATCGSGGGSEASNLSVRLLRSQQITDDDSNAGRQEDGKLNPGYSIKEDNAP